MGIENRDYLRDDEPSWNGPRRMSGSSSVVTALIGVTVAIYVLQIILNNRTTGSSVIQDWMQLTAVDVFRRGQVWRLLGYAFVHSPRDLLHVIMNMLLLFSMGRMLQEQIGRREFLWFYLAAAVFAGIVSVAAYSILGRFIPIVGASGAVLAVVTVLALTHPRQQLLFMGAIPIEFRWVLAIFIGLDVLMMASGMGERLAIANGCHLGGALFGYLYVQWNMGLTRWWDVFAKRVSVKRKSRGKLKLFAPATQPEVNLTEQVDAILEKISREGEASLTDRERKILTTASKQLRKGRE